MHLFNTNRRLDNNGARLLFSEKLLTINNKKYLKTKLALDHLFASFS